MGPRWISLACRGGGGGGVFKQSSVFEGLLDIRLYLCLATHSLVKQRINAGFFCKDFARVNVAKSEEMTSASICVCFFSHAKAPSIISDFSQKKL